MKHTTYNQVLSSPTRSPADLQHITKPKNRIGSNGEARNVNISQSTYQLIKDNADFAFESRGKIEAKGKGEIKMWFVSENV